MNYLIITSSEKEAYGVITQYIIDESTFCVLTFEEDKSTHYFVSDELTVQKVEYALHLKGIKSNRVIEQDLHKISPIYDKPVAMKRKYTFIGDADLMPFGIHHYSR